MRAVVRLDRPAIVLTLVLGRSATWRSLRIRQGERAMSWWNFLTLLFGPSRRSATRRRNDSLYLLRNTPPAGRLRRAWRWMRATG